MSTDAAMELRERLETMRNDLVVGLAQAPHLDSGLLALLRTVGSALRAIEDQQQQAETPG